MLKFEHIEVFNIEGAIRGMRNPYDSWDKSDSRKTYHDEFIIGPADLKLAQSLIKSGGVHRKFMRQIMVSVDITGPIFWWSEFDTYKVGTVANSCSTMHTLCKHELMPHDCGLDDGFAPHISWIAEINELIRAHQACLIESDKNKILHEIKTMLPSGFLQKRTVTMNYENLFAMCSADQRRFHKLPEWRVDFMMMAKGLPYADELIFLNLSESHDVNQ